MKYIVANWKMNLGLRESVALARGTLQTLQGKEKVPEIVIAPSFTALPEVKKTLVRTRASLGAQNVGPGKAGAYTGEIGLSQLHDIGCEYVIIGHSERRLILGEPDEVIAEKVKAVFEGSTMTPILCVGESAETRQNGQVESFVKGQLEQSLCGVKIPHRRKLVIAYEPVWAIGSGMPATPIDAIAIHAFIRKTVIDLTKIAPAELIILYGGSVDAANAYALLREPEIDGLLVGGASLKIHEIHAVIEAACEVISAQASV